MSNKVTIMICFGAGYLVGAAIDYKIDHFDERLFLEHKAPKLSEKEEDVFRLYEMASREIDTGGKGALLKFKLFIPLNEELNSANAYLWSNAVWACAELDDEECMKTLSESLDPETKSYWKQRMKILRKR